ncbi:hypothetical protein ACQVSM_28910, partial [Bacillus mobilis]
AMKVARTVLSGGKDGDNFKVLPIATFRLRDGDMSLTFIEIFVGRESSTFTTYNIPNSFNGVSNYFNKISCSGSKWISI